MFAAMASVNLVSPPQKLNSNNTNQRNTRRFNAAFFHWIPPVSVVQFTVQMSKLNGLGKTHQERTFGVKLKSKLRSLFHYEQIVWEIQILNEWKFYRLVRLKPNTSCFNFLGTFCERLKLICRRLLGRLSRNDTIAYTN